MLLSNVYLLILNIQKGQRITHLYEKTSKLDSEKVTILEELDDYKYLFVYNTIELKGEFCNNIIKVGEDFEAKIYLTNYNINIDDEDEEKDYIVYGGRIDSHWNYSGFRDTIFVEESVGILSVKGLEIGEDTIHGLYHHINNGRLIKLGFKIPYKVY